MSAPSWFIQTTNLEAPELGLQDGRTIHASLLETSRGSFAREPNDRGAPPRVTLQPTTES